MNNKTQDGAGTTKPNSISTVDENDKKDIHNHAHTLNHGEVAGILSTDLKYVILPLSATLI